MDELSTTGVPIWVVGVVGTVVLLAQAFPRLLGPIGAAIHEWAEKRRRAAVEKDDADIAERDRVTDYLRRRLAADRTEIEERDRLIIAHMRWDQESLTRDPSQPAPPPLWPTRRACDEEPDPTPHQED